MSNFFGADQSILNRGNGSVLRWKPENDKMKFLKSSTPVRGSLRRSICLLDWVMSSKIKMFLYTVSILLCFSEVARSVSSNCVDKINTNNLDLASAVSALRRCEQDVQIKCTKNETVGLDGYYKLARNLIDEGQFGAPIILTAFNYAKAYVAGAIRNLIDEGQFGAPIILTAFNYAKAYVADAIFTVSYDQGPWSIYGNAAYSCAMGTDITSAQFNFGADELAYIAQHYIHLDHDQTWTASAGAAYTFNQGTKYQTRVSVDLVAQSGGLRASTGVIGILIAHGAAEMQQAVLGQDGGIGEPADRVPILVAARHGVEKTG